MAVCLYPSRYDDYDAKTFPDGWTNNHVGNNYQRISAIAPVLQLSGLYGLNDKWSLYHATR